MRMECLAKKFEHEAPDFLIGRVKISADKICLN